MKSQGVEAPPCTVTADFHVKLRRPTPQDHLLRLTSRVLEESQDRVKVESILESIPLDADLQKHPELKKVCATCVGTFVGVKPGHPAYHRW